MKTHNKLSLFERLLAWFDKDYLLVPKYTIKYYLRTINMYKKFYTQNEKEINYLLKNWNKSIENNGKIIKTNELLFDTIKNYNDRIDITNKVIDSLIGELIINGVSEEEIAEMFPDNFTYNNFNTAKYEK